MPKETAEQFRDRRNREQMQKDYDWMEMAKGGPRQSPYSETEKAPKKKAKRKRSPRHMLGEGAAGKAAESFAKRRREAMKY